MTRNEVGVLLEHVMRQHQHQHELALAHRKICMDSEGTSMILAAARVELERLVEEGAIKRRPELTLDLDYDARSVMLVLEKGDNWLWPAFRKAPSNV